MQTIDGQMLLTIVAADAHPHLTVQVAAKPTIPPAVLLARGGRTFCDGTGQWWSVYEYDCASKRRGAGCCLVFESISVMRRIGHFPRHWRRLSAAELETLSWQT